ncbi:MAG: M15 family metallopeptidase [Lachnospiraceae bacterium]|nr:M15 family metallopeptidase [Lachnospiraceae bacterium]
MLLSQLVNADHPLDEHAIPKNLVICHFPFCADYSEEKRQLCEEAALAATDLIVCAKTFGYTLFGISGYRSFARQSVLYAEAEVRRASRGTSDDAQDYPTVAAPGTSEHQTGLALDVSTPSVGMELCEEFADTIEGRWLTDYAPMHGFILRYPKGKEKITGYAFEPWHIRYVGKSLALYLTLTGMTLEEYHKI